MNEFWNIAIPIAALLGSIVLAAVLLARARAHAKPEPPENHPQVPASASRRQRRLLEKLEPAPELPTLMDLVRQEIADLGIEDIPGHENLSKPVLLKVYRRDQAAVAACDHNAPQFVISDGVPAQEAVEEQVALVCSECEVSGTNPQE